MEMFKDQYREVGEIRFDCDPTKVAVYGSVDIHRSKEGLDKARALLAVFQVIVENLEGKDLPETLPNLPEETVRNPFL